LFHDFVYTLVCKHPKVNEKVYSEFDEVPWIQPKKSSKDVQHGPRNVAMDNMSGIRHVLIPR
jgi:hypothetical protein